MTLRVRNKAIRKVCVSDLEDAPWNFRTHPDEQRGALEGAIDELGFYGYPDVYEAEDGRLVICDGHLRKDLLIAKYGSNTKIEVNVTDFDEAEAKKATLTKDPLAAMAEADGEALSKLLAEIETGSEALGKMLKELGEGAGIVAEPQVLVDPEPQIDRAAELQKERGTATGQLWEIPGKAGVHRLLCGDATKAEDVARVMGGERAALVVTSPPYNQGLDKFKPSGMHTETRWIANVQSGSYSDSQPEQEYQDEQAAALGTWATVLAEDGSVFYNHKNRYRDKQVVSPWRWIEAAGAKVRQEIIWKREGSVTQNARMFLPCDERLFWLYFGEDFYFDDSTEHKTWSSVWEINSHKDLGLSTHGCAFPVELVARPIRACSRTGDAVLDPFLGSGTTMVAAEQLGRVCYGIEIEPKYVAVALERLADLGLKPELSSAAPNPLQKQPRGKRKRKAATLTR